MNKRAVGALALAAVLLASACGADPASVGMTPTGTTVAAADDCGHVHADRARAGSLVKIGFHGFERGDIRQTPEGWFLSDCVAHELHHALALIEAHDIVLGTDDAAVSPGIAISASAGGIVVSGLPEIHPMAGAALSVGLSRSDAKAVDGALDGHYGQPTHGHDKPAHLHDDAELPTVTTHREAAADNPVSHDHCHRHDRFHIAQLPDAIGDRHCHVHAHDDHRLYDHDHDHL